MIDIEKIGHALGGCKKNTSGVLCKCPCHDDKTSSLSLKITENQKLAINCFAGCSFETVRAELDKRGLLEKKEETAKKSDYEIIAIYSYTDENGVELFQKYRTRTKKGLHRRKNPNSTSKKDEWIYNIKDTRNVLYNLPAVLKSDVVYLCEGEKDADNLNRLGLCATTNNAGALSWRDSFTQSLKGKNIIVCQDNDRAGEMRTAKLYQELIREVKSFRVFIPSGVPEHGDVTDWLDIGGDAQNINILAIDYVEKKEAALKDAQEKYKDKKRESKNPQEQKPRSKKERIPDATRDDYYKLYDIVLNNPKRCIFAQKVMTLDETENLWNPAINYLEIIKSEAVVLNETQTNLEYKLGNILPHFKAYETTKQAQLLVDIPEWDGQDRISEMAYWCNIKQNFVTEEDFSELLKEWMATMFLRLHNPLIQNKIIVLQGNQGLGKDTWVNHLLGGLNQFLVPFKVSHDTKDMYLQLHQGLVMNISEFDKTAKTEISVLKDIITAEKTNIRAPYDVDARIRFSRCSFISSANIENILRDYTGNRRFMIFEVKKIDYIYKKWTKEEKKLWQSQCLAQGKYLADINYKAREECHDHMRDFIVMHTPDKPTVQIEELLINLWDNNAVTMGKDELSSQEMNFLYPELKKLTGLNSRGLQPLVRGVVGVYKKENGRSFWVYKRSRLMN